MKTLFLILTLITLSSSLMATPAPHGGSVEAISVTELLFAGIVFVYGLIRSRA